MTTYPWFIKDKTFTKTSRFLLPATNLKFVNLYNNLGLINAYLGDSTDVTKNIYEKCLFLVFDMQNYVEYQDEFEVLRYFPNFVDEYHYDTHVVFIVSIDEIWGNMYNLFIEGKYSEMARVRANVTKEINLKSSAYYNDVGINSSYLENFYKKWFYAKDSDGQDQWILSQNYRVLTLCEDLRKELGEFLKVELKPESELCGVPNESEYFSISTLIN